MYGNYMVAFCDILGFRELVENNSLESVVDQALSWFAKAVKHSLPQSDSGFPTETPSIASLQQHPDVGLMWFSDSVLFHTRTDSDDAIQNLLSTVACLLFETITASKTRVRAGVAYGPAYIDHEKALFVGQPIIDAYRLEQVQQWAGAALTTSAVNRLPAEVRSGQYADWWVWPYRVPCKGGSLDTLAIDWLTATAHTPGWEPTWKKDAPVPTVEDWLTQSEVCVKFQNTKRFHDEVCWCKKRDDLVRFESVRSHRA